MPNIKSFSLKRLAGLLCLAGFFFVIPAKSQQVWQTDAKDVQLVYIGNRYTFLTPHVLRTFRNAHEFHKTLWDYDPGKLYILLNDFQDYGNGGAITMPLNQVFIGIGPYNFAYTIIPSYERFQWLFNHELTHTVMTDKPNRKDLFWRRVFLGKVRRTEQQPLSALWSYATVPRWYAPRWYQEGIACFMETWMSGGQGRAMGYYDEMYFRSIVHEGATIHSVVGLETEGTSEDFQVGANAYLYGTRFVTYLTHRYGADKMQAFFLRSEDSKAFYASQFRKIYGKPVTQAWNEWREAEREFQNENIALISEYPLTPFTPIVGYPLGSMSSYRFNPETGKIYAAINHPGIISQIAEIDIQSGRIRKIAELDAPALYYSTHLAYDPDSERIFITEHNNKYRSLVALDVKSGRKETLIPFSRTGDLVINPKDKSLWGVMINNGYSVLVKIPQPYNNMEIMYAAPFGTTLFDLDISPDGGQLSASITGIRGEQELGLFDIKTLESGNQIYRSLYKLEDNTLTQFKFSLDGTHLIGTSYYTGVSNVWRINIENPELELMTNTETGFFMPLQYSSDSLFVLRFFRDGMKPGLIPIKILNEANAIEFLGHQTVERNPVLEEWSLPPPPPLDQEQYTEKAYHPLKEMILTNAWPDLAGYKNTLATGYRLQWRDPLALAQIDLFLAGSPWSNYKDEQKLHAHLDVRYRLWEFTSSWNKTDFYDLFGPTKRSRAGYHAGISYKYTNTIKAPRQTSYHFGLHTYGKLEVLPNYQSIETPIRQFQSATAGYGISKLRRTLGGIDDEKGYKWNITASTLFAGGDFYPSLISEQSVGFLVPLSRNTSFWLRNTSGASFGTEGSALSNFYLGGFRNNYIDWRDARQYRGMVAFPGAAIDAIPARQFVRTMAELNFRPLRMRNFGTTWLYPTHAFGSVFGSHLITDPLKGNGQRNLFNAGFQLDLEVVMFSYMKTTWSAGYARVFENEGHVNRISPSGQWMFSIKLLGN